MPSSSVSPDSRGRSPARVATSWSVPLFIGMGGSGKYTAEESGDTGLSKNPASASELLSARGVRVESCELTFVGSIFGGGRVCFNFLFEDLRLNRDARFLVVDGTLSELPAGGFTEVIDVDWRQVGELDMSSATAVVVEALDLDCLLALCLAFT